MKEGMYRLGLDGLGEIDTWKVQLIFITLNWFIEEHRERVQPATHHKISCPGEQSMWIDIQ